MGILLAAGTAQAAAWFPGPNFPNTADIRSVGVFFPANGKFYAMGGRTSDSAGSDLRNPSEFDPVAGTWAVKTGAFDDGQVNNMAAGVLNVGGTDYIFTVGGSAAGNTTATAEVRRYDPVADAFVYNAGDAWPGDAGGNVLPGGFAVYNNKLYIIGGFQINTSMENFIYQFDPNAASGSQWTLMTATLTVQPLGYVPACTIGNLIYTAGGSMWTGSTLADTTDSYVFDPVADTIALLTNQIPRATAETRALNFNGQMWVLGGGRVAPNPSNEVDIYDPVAGTWSTGLAFNQARRNFPADTNGTNIWLDGGYAPTAPTNAMEIYGLCGTVIISPGTLPNGNYGVSYSQQLTASGGSQPFTFTVTAGALPNGLTVDTTGLLSGSPLEVGTFMFTVQAVNSDGCTGSQAYTLTIDCGTISILPSNPILPAGQTGTFYSQTFTASGGASPFTFSVFAGTLPPGLTLDSAGNLTGTPTAGGTSNFTVHVVDAFNCAVNAAYSLTINVVFSVLNISPQCGPAAGGTSVTINGFAFDPAATVTIAGNAATNVVVNGTGTQITADTAANSPGVSGDVVITNPGPATATLTNGYGYDYLDVPSTNPFHSFVCAMERNQITGGCGGGNYCPANSVIRSSMAVFIIKAEHGSSYTPPSANCATFPFTDVACPSVIADYVQQMVAEGITSGCSPTLFCPTNPVLRNQMAVFLLTGEHGMGYTPPACTPPGQFTDVPCPGSGFTNWIYQLVAEGITGGCTATTYCPTAAVSRGSMAVFLTVTFSLP
jgi:hypothetical protein